MLFKKFLSSHRVNSVRMLVQQVLAFKAGLLSSVSANYRGDLSVSVMSIKIFI